MRTSVANLAMSFCLLAFSAQAANLNTLLMPADRLSTIKAALPKVTDPNLAQILNDPQTLWYDATVMAPSYQDSVGASSNDHWPDLVAGSEEVIGGLHNRTNHNWQFPFAATAGTDESTNLQVENFVRFPQTGGNVQTVDITTVTRNDRPEWSWQYQVGTVFGEILFITDGGNLLPTEIRTRTKYATGWAMNVYRPFPKASDLISAIKWLRPGWSSTANLKALIDFLGDNTTLKPYSLSAKAALAPTFQQDGYLDTLPDFGDDELVRQLLTTTPFRSAYDTNWKKNGNQAAYAASTKSRLSIVPTNYTAGVIRVTDDSCTRCHQEGSRMVSEFYDALYLYGEIWGMDGIFTFHPYDESRYSELRMQGGDVDGYRDNRSLNPTLQQARIFRRAFR